MLLCIEIPTSIVYSSCVFIRFRTRCYENVFTNSLMILVWTLVLTKCISIFQKLCLVNMGSFFLPYGLMFYTTRVQHGTSICHVPLEPN